MHPPYPGQLVITRDDRGPIANLGAWLAMCVMVLCVASKVVTKGLCIGRLQKDDLFITLTMLFASAHVATVSLQVKFGLGRSLPGSVDVVQLQHAMMASEIFYIVALGFAQLSILQYIVFLSRDARHRLATRCLSVLSALWTTASFFSILFQCHPPLMGTVFSDQCFDHIKFWTAWTIVGGAIDAAIGLLPIFLLWKVPIRRAVKSTVLIAFASRILALPVAIVRLVYIVRTRTGDNLSYTMLDVVLLTTVHMNASIVLTCVPFLKPVFDGLQSGIWDGELRSNSLSYALSTLTSSLGRKSQKHASGKLHSSEKTPSNKDAAPVGKSDEMTSTFAECVGVERSHVGNTVHEREVSDDSTNPMVINQVTTITVERTEQARRGEPDWLPIQGTATGMV